MTQQAQHTQHNAQQGDLANIKDLSVSFMTDAGSIKAVEDVNFTIPRKTVVGVVGESGSGKSVTARSIIKLLPETATTSGAIYLSNREDTGTLDVLSLSGEQLRTMRGSQAAMVFQEPNSVLNPVYTIGWQIEEGLRAHGMKDKKELRAKAIDILKKVGIPDAETRVDYYPHQFSGGQKQRIVIAMALVLNPGLILADEPTTALDVTVQAEILDLLRLARDEFGASVLIITHNMGVVADIADEVVVMYRGHVVEQGPVEQIFYKPQHEYTQRLLAAVPRIGQHLVVRDRKGNPIERKTDWHDEPLAVKARNLSITYPGHLMQPDFKAVDGIDFENPPFRSARTGGRIRFRQVDHGPCHRRPAEGHRRFAQRAGRGDERREGARFQGQARRHRIRVPGPGILVRPADDHRRERGGTPAGAPQVRFRSRGEELCGRFAGNGAAAARVHGPLPA